MKTPQAVAQLRAELEQLPDGAAVRKARDETIAALEQLNEAGLEATEVATAKSNLFSFLRAHPVLRGCVDGALLRESHTSTGALTAGLERAMARVAALEGKRTSLLARVDALLEQSEPVASVLQGDGGKAAAKQKAVTFLAGQEYIQLSTLRTFFGRSGHVPSVDVLQAIDKAYEVAVRANDAPRLAQLDAAFNDTDWLMNTLAVEVGEALERHDLVHLHPRGKEKFRTEPATVDELLPVIRTLAQELELLCKDGELEHQVAELEAAKARVERHLQLRVRGLAAYERLPNLLQQNVLAGIATRRRAAPRLTAALQQLQAQHAELADLRNATNLAHSRATLAQRRASEAAIALATWEAAQLAEDREEATADADTGLLLAAERDAAAAEAATLAETARTRTAELMAAEEKVATSSLLMEAAQASNRHGDIEATAAMSAGLKASALTYLKLHPLLSDLAPTRLLGNVQGQAILEALDAALVRVEKVRAREQGPSPLLPTVATHLATANALTSIRQKKTGAEWHARKDAMQRDLEAVVRNTATVKPNLLERIAAFVSSATERQTSAALKGRIDTFLLTPESQAASREERTRLDGYSKELGEWTQRRQKKDAFLAFLGDPAHDMGHLVPRSSDVRAANKAPASSFAKAFAQVEQDLAALCTPEVVEELTRFRDRLAAREAFAEQAARAETETKALQKRLSEAQSNLRREMDSVLQRITALKALIATTAETLATRQQALDAALGNAALETLTTRLTEARETLELLPDTATLAQRTTAEELVTQRKDEVETKRTELGIPTKQTALYEAHKAHDDAEASLEGTLQHLLALNERARALQSIQDADRQLTRDQSSGAVGDGRSALATRTDRATVGDGVRTHGVELRSTGRVLVQDLLPDGSGHWLYRLGIGAEQYEAQLAKNLAAAVERLKALKASGTRDEHLSVRQEIPRLQERLAHLVATKEGGKSAAKLRLLEALKAPGRDARTQEANRALGFRRYLRTGHNASASFVKLLEHADSQAQDASSKLQIHELLALLQPLAARAAVKREVLDFFEEHGPELGGLRPRSSWYSVRQEHAPFLALHESLLKTKAELQGLEGLKTTLAELGTRIRRRHELKELIRELTAVAEAGQRTIAAAHAGALKLWSSVNQAVSDKQRARRALLEEIQVLEEQLPLLQTDVDALVSELGTKQAEAQALSEEDGEEAEEASARDAARDARRAALKTEMASLQRTLGRQQKALAQCEVELELKREKLRLLDEELVELLEIQVLAVNRASEVQVAHDKLEQAFKVHKAVKTLTCYLRTRAQLDEAIENLRRGLGTFHTYEADALASVNCILCVDVGVRAGVDVGFAELAGRVRLTLALSGWLSLNESRQVEFGYRFTVIVTAEVSARAGLDRDAGVGLVSPGLLPTPDVLLKASATAGVTLADQSHCALYTDADHFQHHVSQEIARRVTFLMHWRHGASADLDENLATATQGTGLTAARSEWLQAKLRRVSPPTWLDVKRLDLDAHATLTVAANVNSGESDTPLLRKGGANRTGKYALRVRLPTGEDVDVGRLEEHLSYFKPADGENLPLSDDSLAEFKGLDEEGDCCAPTATEYRTAVFHRFSPASAPTRFREYLQYQTHKNSSVTDWVTSAVTGMSRDAWDGEAAARLTLGLALHDDDRTLAAVGGPAQRLASVATNAVLWPVPEAFASLMAPGAGARVSGFHAGAEARIPGFSELKVLQDQVGRRMIALRTAPADLLAKLHAPHSAIQHALSQKVNGFVRYVSQQRPVLGTGGRLAWQKVFTPEVLRLYRTWARDFTISSPDIEVAPFVAVQLRLGQQLTVNSSLCEVLGLETFQYLKALRADGAAVTWDALAGLHEDEFYVLCHGVTDFTSGPFAEVAHDLLEGSGAQKAAARRFGTWCARNFRVAADNPFHVEGGAELTATGFQDQLVALLGRPASAQGARRQSVVASDARVALHVLQGLNAGTVSSVHPAPWVQHCAQVTLERMRTELHRYGATRSGPNEVLPCFELPASELETPTLSRAFPQDVRRAFERFKRTVDAVAREALPSHAALCALLDDARKDLSGLSGPPVPAAVASALEAWHAPLAPTPEATWNSVDLERNLTPDPSLVRAGRRDPVREVGERTVAARALPRAEDPLRRLAALQQAVETWRAAEAHLQGAPSPVGSGAFTLSEYHVSSLYQDLLRDLPGAWDTAAPPNAFGGRDRLSIRRGDLGGRDIAAVRADVEQQRRSLKATSTPAPAPSSSFNPLRGLSPFGRSQAAPPAEDLSLYLLLADLTWERPAGLRAAEQAVAEWTALHKDCVALAGMLEPVRTEQDVDVTERYFTDAERQRARERGQGTAALGALTAAAQKVWDLSREATREADALDSARRASQGGGLPAEAAFVEQNLGKLRALRDRLRPEVYSWARSTLRWDTGSSGRAEQREKLDAHLAAREANLQREAALARGRAAELQSREGFAALLTRDGLSLGSLLAACAHHEARVVYVAGRGVATSTRRDELDRFAELKRRLASLRELSWGRLEGQPQAGALLPALQKRLSYLSSVDQLLSQFLSVPAVPDVTTLEDAAAFEARLVTALRTTSARAKMSARADFEIPGARTWNDGKGQGRSMFSRDSAATGELDQRVAANEQSRRALMGSWGERGLMTDERERERRHRLSAQGLRGWLDEAEVYNHMLRERCGVGLEMLLAVNDWTQGKTLEGSQRLPQVVSLLELPALREIIRAKAALLALSARAELVKVHAAIRDVKWLTRTSAQAGTPAPRTPQQAFELLLGQLLPRSADATRTEAWSRWSARMAATLDRPGDMRPRSEQPPGPAWVYFRNNRFDRLEWYLEGPLAKLRLALLSSTADLLDALAASAHAYRSGFVDRAEMLRELKLYLEASKPEFEHVGFIHSIRQQRMPGTPIHAVVTDPRTRAEKVQDSIKSKVSSVVSDELAERIEDERTDAATKLAARGSFLATHVRGEEGTDDDEPIAEAVVGAATGKAEALLQRREDNAAAVVRTRTGMHARMAELRVLMERRQATAARLRTPGGGTLRGDASGP